MSNLRPLHWLNNSSKGTDYPEYRARITSDGNHNKLLENEGVYVVSDVTQNELMDKFGKYIG